MPITPAAAAMALDKLPLTKTLRSALAASAEQLASAVRDELTATPGSSHATPWRQTGALEESIQCGIEGLSAVVGSNDLAAALQEFGTMHIAPRPFFGPAAAVMAEGIARDIGGALAAIIGRHAT